MAKIRMTMIGAGIFVSMGVIATLASCRPTAPLETVSVGWKEDFSSSAGPADSIPKDWAVMGKPGTRPAAFSIVTDKVNGLHHLHIEADKASGSLLYQLKNVNLKANPVLRWRWRAIALPDSGDGRIASRDDQAIGIYVGTGSMLNKKSISYRWDTETPKGAEGTCSYGAGTVKVKWYTLRNKDDVKTGEWFIEERDFAEDFKKAWGYYPENVYIGISCNSQYTGSNAAAELDWIELVPIPNKT